MNVDALPLALVLAIVLTIGVRDTWFLRREYNAVAGDLLPRYRELGRAFVVASAAILVALGWFAVLTVRRLLGFEQLGDIVVLGLSIPVGLIGLLISIPVLMLPHYFRRVWQRVGDNPAPGTKMRRRKRGTDGP